VCAVVLRAADRGQRSPRCGANCVPLTVSDPVPKGDRPDDQPSKPGAVAAQNVTDVVVARRKPGSGRPGAPSRRPRRGSPVPPVDLEPARPRGLAWFSHVGGVLRLRVDLPDRPFLRPKVRQTQCCVDLGARDQVADGLSTDVDPLPGGDLTVSKRIQPCMLWAAPQAIAQSPWVTRAYERRLGFSWAPVR
jgi:hypothetical protein